jgi:anti-sigma regulatory factor (Ser/Thr protein kinase)
MCATPGTVTRPTVQAGPEPRSGAGGADWPLVSTLEFGSLPTAVACARAHARSVLFEWGLGHLADDVVTLSSELVTNALQASWTLKDRPPVVLRLLANDRQLLIEAWDQCIERLDLAPRASSDAEHGRGLLVVAALSNRWGVGRMGSRFKVVWCELRTVSES